MHAIETRLETANAGRYLTQLCKHWSHRFSVTYTAENGRVPFSETTECLLTADAEGLTVRINATEPDDTTRLGNVVIEHLQRFAFREPLAAPVWRALTAS